MKAGKKASGSKARGHYSRSGLTRRAVGYTRVSIASCAAATTPSAAAPERARARRHACVCTYTPPLPFPRGAMGVRASMPKLRAQGVRTRSKRGAQLLQQDPVAARTRRRSRRTTDSRHGRPVAPNRVLRNFSLERAEEALARGVVVAVSRSAHAADQVVRRSIDPGRGAPEPSVPAWRARAAAPPRGQAPPARAPGHHRASRCLGGPLRQVRRWIEPYKLDLTQL